MGVITRSTDIPQSVFELRHQLHRFPELSGCETETAKRVVDFFRSLNPDRIIKNIGGTGVAIVFGKPGNGQTILLRCELDALQIDESNSFAHRSSIPGVSHKCGHDGHMSILCAVGCWLSNHRPKFDRVVLLFQPAEENGEGARMVLADPQFAHIKPDMAFAFHNLPGFEMGQVVVRNGIFAAASRGMCVTLAGSTAHAAQPDTGRSPVRVANSIIEKFAAKTDPTVWCGELPMITVVGAKIGNKDFGVSPSDATIWATLRAGTDEGMKELVLEAETIIFDVNSNRRLVGNGQPLSVAIEYEEIFEATFNSKRLTDIVTSSAEGLSIIEIDAPFRWSEDFGRFSSVCESVLFGIGAGANTPALHDANYDFPDDLIPIATDVFIQIIQDVTNERSIAN